MVKLTKIPKDMSYFEFEDEVKKQRKKYRDVHIKSKGLVRYIEASGRIK